MLTGRKLPLTLAFVVLIGLAFGASCKGFFVDPTLTSITVGPTNVNIPIGQHQQMTATGTYSPDGNQKDITTAKGIVWQSSDENQATVNGTGDVTGVGIGTPTITAQLGTVSGPTTVNITLTNVTAITITPSTSNISTNGGTATFQAMATISGQTQKVDVSAQAVWTIQNSANYTLTQNVTPETVTALSTAPVGEVDILTATYTSGTTQFTSTAKLTVTQ
jgi:hypothetical protein